MGPDLLTFGETMLRLSPPGDRRLERTDRLAVAVAGAESNVACVASRLGVEATWLSKLPDSPPARRVVADLRAHGVDTAVVEGEGRQGLYYLERAPPPRGANVVYDRADAAVTTLSPDEVPTDLVRESRAVHTSGITPALSETLAETTAWVLETAREAGATTTFDLNYRSKLWSPAEARAAYEELFPAVEVLVVAERDARRVLDREGSPAEVARGLAAEFDFETTVVTRGAEGALAVADGELLEQPAFEAETVSPIGTGDAFVGGFLARLLDGGSVPESLEYGAATAALKRTIPGDVAAVTPAEVEAVLAGDDEALSR